MLPSLIWGTLPSNSSLHNLTWAAQFSEQVRSGILYPRWMPDSFNGLGAPTFYFYPPLAFWLDSLVRCLTFDIVSTSYRLSVSTLLLLWTSGLAMYAWLRLETVERRIALFGALIYMAAPYHLVDHYVRGAIAEFAAYTALPLVMCGIALIAGRRRTGPCVLAFAYAALVLAHLPTALLISITAIPAYVLFTAIHGTRNDRWFLPRCAVAAVLGLGIAAPYLLPALTLQAAVLIEWMWLYGFKVKDSLLLMPGRWVQAPYMYVTICSIAAGWLATTLGALWSWRRGSREPRHASIALWSFVSLVALVLMSGVVPWFWTLPIVSQVGFPWRLLIVVEFAALSALCLGPWPIRERLSGGLLWLAVVGFVPGVVVTLKGIVDRVELAVAGQVPPLQDAREYMPAGYPQRRDAGYADLNLELTIDVPLVACLPAVRVCRADQGRFGTMRIAVDGDQPTKVTLRRFVFPAWKLDPPLPIVGSKTLRLVSFDAPAGRQTYSLTRRTLPSEQWGWGLACASLILLGLLAAIDRAPRRRISTRTASLPGVNPS